jgi:Protein of unknown function (DUF1580)
VQDVQNVADDLISLTAASRLLPSHPNPATLWRWRTKGIRGIRLQTVLVGGRRFVTRKAIEEFIQRLTEAAEQRATDIRQERSQATIVDLKSAGLL